MAALLNSKKQKLRELQREIDALRAENDALRTGEAAAGAAGVPWQVQAINGLAPFACLLLGCGATLQGRARAKWVRFSRCSQRRRQRARRQRARQEMGGMMRWRRQARRCSKVCCGRGGREIRDWVVGRRDLHLRQGSCVSACTAELGF